MAYTGEIKMFAGSFAPRGWLVCDGSTQAVSDFPDLAATIKSTFGGDATTFRLPDLRGRVPIHTSPRYNIGATGGSETALLTADQLPAHSHTLYASDGAATSRSASSGMNLSESQGRIYGAAQGNLQRMSPAAVSSAGGGQAHDNMGPSLSVNFIICTSGVAVTQQDRDFQDEAFVGEIKIFAGNFAWKGFAKCEGQILPLGQNTVLFSILGLFYGGDGRSNFALPDLRGAAPMGAGAGPGLTSRFLGDVAGSQDVRLTPDQMPAHTHPIAASAAQATSNDPTGNVLATPFSGDNLYSAQPGPTVPLSTQFGPIGNTGSSFPHNNMQPFLAMTFMIAIQGIYPVRP